MTVDRPDASTRWRCTACGNLTRFDVERTTRARDFVHVDLAGEPSVEESEVVSEVVDKIVCRWCGATNQVELVPRPAASAEAAPSP